MYLFFAVITVQFLLMFCPIAVCRGKLLMVFDRMSYVYTLNSMGESTPPWGTPVLDWDDVECGCVVSECCVRLASSDIVCDGFDDGGWNVCF